MKYLIFVFSFWLLGCSFVDTDAEESFSLKSYQAEVGNILKRGQYSKAVEYSEKALSKAQKLIGKESVEVGVILRRLGVLYGSVGERDKSINSLVKSLEILEAKWGIKNDEVGRLARMIALRAEQYEFYEISIRYFQKELKYIKGSEKTDSEMVKTQQDLNRLAIKRDEREIRDKFISIELNGKKVITAPIYIFKITNDPKKECDELIEKGGKLLGGNAEAGFKLRFKGAGWIYVSPKQIGNNFSGIDFEDQQVIYVFRFKSSAGKNKFLKEHQLTEKVNLKSGDGQEKVIYKGKPGEFVKFSLPAHYFVCGDKSCELHLNKVREEGVCAGCKKKLLPMMIFE